MLPLRIAAQLVSPSGHRARLSVLIYHRVLPTSDPLRRGITDAESFHWQMRLLSDNFTVLAMEEAVDRLRAGDLPARAACITFDDGYADNAEIALPILKSFDVTATFFVATGYLDGGCMWNDRIIEAIGRTTVRELDLSSVELGRYRLDDLPCRVAAISELIGRIKYLPVRERDDKVSRIVEASGAAIPTNLMMRSEQVCALKEAGMSVGAHTVSHPILSRIDTDGARREIAESRERLEGLVRDQVTLFAYPNGKPFEDYLPEHVELVRGLRFRAAASTAWGANRRNTDPFQLRRFTPWDRTPQRFMLRLLANCFRAT